MWFVLDIDRKVNIYAQWHDDYIYAPYDISLVPSYLEILTYFYISLVSHTLLDPVWMKCYNIKSQYWWLVKGSQGQISKCSIIIYGNEEARCM